MSYVFFIRHNWSSELSRAYIMRRRETILDERIKKLKKHASQYVTVLVRFAWIFRT